jgi:seryl-tRNA synthetase
MNTRDFIIHLEEKVRSYEAKISELQAKRDALQTAIGETQALLNSAQVLLKDELQAARNASGAEISLLPLAARLANLNLTESIFEIVNSNAGPIHADQVLKKLREAGKTPKGKSPKNTVVSLLHRGVGQGMYDKVGPNLFAPVREREETKSATGESSQKPAFVPDTMQRH